MPSGYLLEHRRRYVHLIVEKGSICIDGSTDGGKSKRKRDFRYPVIPHTGEETTLLEKCRAIR